MAAWLNQKQTRFDFCPAHAMGKLPWPDDVMYNYFDTHTTRVEAERWGTTASPLRQEPLDKIGRVRSFPAKMKLILCMTLYPV
jgi:hypothetical protein